MKPTTLPRIFSAYVTNRAAFDYSGQAPVATALAEEEEPLPMPGLGREAPGSAPVTQLATALAWNWNDEEPLGLPILNFSKSAPPATKTEDAEEALAIPGCLA